MLPHALEEKNKYRGDANREKARQDLAPSLAADERGRGRSI
jgi:hypothetical protein